jgi:hypothetical protein
MTSSVFQCFGHRRIRATSSIVLLRVPPGTFAIRTGYDVRSVYVRYGVAVIAGNRKANIRIPIEVSFIFKQRASSQSSLQIFLLGPLNLPVPKVYRRNSAIRAVK